MTASTPRSTPRLLNSAHRLAALLLLGLCPVVASADVKVIVNHPGNPDKEFKFPEVPEPAFEDAAAKIRMTILEGKPDGNGAGPKCLTDGEFPDEPDAPGRNFFFAPAQDGGVLKLDLRSVRELLQINSYSWHPGTRGPQVYTVYGSDGTAKNFEAKPKRPAAGGSLEDQGWTLIAKVDTRPKDKPQQGGGQYGVSIRDSADKGVIGKYRYLLFDVRSNGGNFGNTFYSEIDVVATGGGPTPESAAEKVKIDPSKPIVLASKSGKYEIKINVAAAPDLADWANDTLGPVLLKWYPNITEMLASDGYDAPTKMTIEFKPTMNNPAATSGTSISCSAEWMRKNLQSEAVGAIVHELAHVAQGYSKSAPGWLVEGIADYIRWYRFEPEGAATRAAVRVPNPDSAKYDAGYRISANFLSYLTERYDRLLVKKLNAALREGKPTDGIWKDSTGKTLEDAAKEWRDQLPR